MARVDENHSALKAIHLMYKAAVVTEDKSNFFYQNIVVWAADVDRAKLQTVEVVAKQGGNVVEFDDEETYEIHPESVDYALSSPEDGVLGMTGKIFFTESSSPQEVSAWRRFVSFVMQGKRRQ